MLKALRKNKMKIDAINQRRMELQLYTLIEATPIEKLIPEDDDYESKFTLSSDYEKFYYVVYKKGKRTGFSLVLGEYRRGYYVVYEKQDVLPWEMIQRKLKPIREAKKRERENDEREDQETFDRKLEKILSLKVK